MPDPTHINLDSCEPMMAALDREPAWPPERETRTGSGLTRGAPRWGGGSWLAGLAAFVLLVSGCAAPQIAATTSSRAGQVVCLRGLLDVFSLGLNDLAERLRHDGIEAITVSGPSWPRLAQSIREARSRGDLRKPLVLVGHSYGADDAIRLARKLKRWNIEVELLVLLDATTPPPVPSNVVRCLHVYRPTVMGDVFPHLFAGNPVDAEPGNHRTQVVNRIVSRESFGAAAAHIGHFSIDASDAVHDLVLREVQSVFPSGIAWARRIGAGSGGPLGGVSRGRH
jgi:pimeloyl-ACP methyl ester carboxylesterase